MTDRIDNLVDNVDRADAFDYYNMVTKLTDRDSEIDLGMSMWLLYRMEIGAYAGVVEVADLADLDATLLAMEIN